MLGVRTLECLFDGMIPKSDPQNYPMQSYLRTVVVNLNMRQLGGIDPHMLVFVSDRALRVAQILFATVLNSSQRPTFVAVFHHRNKADRSKRVIQ